jgi:hypothetical protein
MHKNTVTLLIIIVVGLFFTQTALFEERIYPLLYQPDVNYQK